jgi:very-short-patch-repair endonuclease
MALCSPLEDARHLLEGAAAEIGGDDDAGPGAAVASERIGRAQDLIPELGARLRNALDCVEDSGLSLVPQFKLGPFRYDFAITQEGKTVALVECDGKDYHSTPEHIANDRMKDRLAAKIGAMLFRFSGSHIFRDGKDCVRDIFLNLRWQGYLTQEQWAAVEGPLAPRARYDGD